jgi:DNA-binding XRE family transcriptional regulator
MTNGNCAGLSRAFFKRGDFMTFRQLAADCRRWRELCGISQQEIADKAGMTRQAVSKFESGCCNSLTIYCAYLDMGYKSSWEKGRVYDGR